MGHEGVVRIMVSSKSNFSAVGGRFVLTRATCMATMGYRERIVHAFLNTEGEDKR